MCANHRAGREENQCRDLGLWPLESHLTKAVLLAKKLHTIQLDYIVISIHVATTYTILLTLYNIMQTWLNRSRDEP